MEATKSQAISAKILLLVSQGMNVRAALDAVVGAGTSERLVSELYTELRAKAGKQSGHRTDSREPSSPASM